MTLGGQAYHVAVLRLWMHGAVEPRIFDWEQQRSRLKYWNCKTPKNKANIKNCILRQLDKGSRKDKSKAFDKQQAIMKHSCRCVVFVLNHTILLRRWCLGWLRFNHSNWIASVCVNFVGIRCQMLLVFIWQFWFSTSTLTPRLCFFFFCIWNTGC